MRKELKVIVLVTVLVLVGLLVKALLDKNFEFITYWVVLVLLFLLVVKLDSKYKFPILGVALFSIWSVLHMSGGLIKVGGVRLYDLILVDIIGDPFFILKYDQLIHAFAYFAFSILVYSSMKYYFDRKSGTALVVFSILAALGIGLLNEVIEFGLVIWADAGDAVGGYYNTALDLVFNFIGAVFGPLYARKFLS